MCQRCLILDREMPKIIDDETELIVFIQKLWVLLLLLLAKEPWCHFYQSLFWYKYVNYTINRCHCHLRNRHPAIHNRIYVRPWSRSYCGLWNTTSSVLLCVKNIIGHILALIPSQDSITQVLQILRAGHG